MCETKYIKGLFVPFTFPESRIVAVGVKRSDEEIFNINIQMECENDADKVKNLLKYIEEIRTCSCTKNNVCEIHSDLKRVK